METSPSVMLETAEKQNSSLLENFFGRKLLSFCLQIVPQKVVPRLAYSCSAQGVMAAVFSQVRHNSRASVYIFNMQHSKHQCRGAEQ